MCVPGQSEEKECAKIRRKQLKELEKKLAESGSLEEKLVFLRSRIIQQVFQSWHVINHLCSYCCLCQPGCRSMSFLLGLYAARSFPCLSVNHYSN
jgi:hypothetical protein